VHINSLTPWVGAISALSALIIGLVTALWAYTKFVVERGLLPPTQFEIECNPVGTQLGVTLLEIILHLRNLGSSALIVTNIRVDVRYMKGDETPALVYLDGTEAPQEQARKRGQFGRLNFKGSVRRELECLSTAHSGRGASLMTAAHSAAAEQPVDQSAKSSLITRNRDQSRVDSDRRVKPRVTRGFGVMTHATFIQTGIDQQYSFQTAVPEATTYILVWASFEYAQSPKPIQRITLWLSRRLGLIQFTLRHVIEPHTAERMFKV
jgi:hypothetical protein